MVHPVVNQMVGIDLAKLRDYFGKDIFVPRVVQVMLPGPEKQLPRPVFSS
jgi:hypothetical protein